MKRITVISVFVLILILVSTALANITQTNQTWKPPSSNWGNHAVVDVRILNTSPRKDAIHMSGSGTIGRIFVETHSGDGMKIHGDTNGVTIGSYGVNSSIRALNRYNGVHQDNVQVMGGSNVTFRGLFSEKLVPGMNFFFNMGSGGNSRPTNIVCDFCTVVGVRGGSNPIRISDSLRCGIRHTLVVSDNFPLRVTNNASSPVVVDSYEMNFSEWDAAGQPRYTDLWNSNGSRKPLLNSLIASGNAELLSA